MTKNENWRLDTDSTDYAGKSEAAYLAASSKPIIDRYTPDWIDDKAGEMIVFLECIGAVYGARIFAARATRGPKLATDNVTPLRPEPVKQADVMRQGPVPPAPKPTAPPLPPGLEMGEVAGVGRVQFPADHPLMGGR